MDFYRIFERLNIITRSEWASFSMSMKDRSTLNRVTTWRDFPLREQVLSSWESVGLKFNPDVNGGSSQGICADMDWQKEDLR